MITTKKKGNPGITKLAAALSDRMKSECSRPESIDFGVIQEDFSLRTDLFPVSIPAADYYICVPIPQEMGDTEGRRMLKNGDRVLVVWVQNDPVIIGLID